MQSELPVYTRLFPTQWHLACATGNPSITRILPSRKENKTFQDMKE